MLDSNVLHRAAIDCRDVYTDDRPFFFYVNDEWYFDEFEDVTEITIRGSDRPTSSDGFLDWLKNLDTKVVDFFNYRVARGFRPNTLIDGMEERGNELRRDKPVRIKGHSRGGALGQTLAIHLDQRGFKIDSVITFGSPRISRETIKTEWPVWQFKAFGDPVWRVPFLPPFTWRHSGETFKVGNWRTFENLRSKFGFWTYSRTAISSHLMPNYINLLKVPE